MRFVIAALLITAAGALLMPARTVAAAPIAPERIAVAAPAVTLDPDPAPAPEVEEDRLAQLGTPDPSRLPPASAARAIGEFLDAWHDRAWDRMALWATGDPADLRARYAVERLRGWAVTDQRRVGGVAIADVAVAVRGMRPLVTRRTLSLVATRGDDGRWRVMTPDPPATVPAEA